MDKATFLLKLLLLGFEANDDCYCKAPITISFTQNPFIPVPTTSILRKDDCIFISTNSHDFNTIYQKLLYILRQEDARGFNK
jgi:hypothetical protein